MYVVGMDVDTFYVSINNVNYWIKLGYLLKISFYLIIKILRIKYINYYPNKFFKTYLNHYNGPFTKNLNIKKGGTISFNLIKNNQQEIYLAQSANYTYLFINCYNKLTTIRKTHYSTYSMTFHRPKYNHSDISDEHLGYYLAGLIEGDGHFSKRLEIIFHEKDIAWIQFLKKKIGFGSIYKIKDIKAYKFSLGSKQGFQRIFELINGKLVANHKIHQFNKNPYNLILSAPTFSVSYSNAWLAGFLDADGNLGIFTTPSKTHNSGKSCRLSIRITQKDILLLNLIKKGLNNEDILIRFDGLVHRLSMNHRSTILKNMVEYLDNFPFLSKKNLQYFYWRKAYLLMLNNEHLTPNGLFKLIDLKTKMAKIYTDPQRLHA
jgi:hypothetical protein